jgi:CheY-like chemotaxis protein
MTNQLPNPPERAILLVDDDDDHCWLMSDALRSAGWAGPIGRAETPHVALDMLTRSAEHVGLVLLDVNMPGMDGLTLLARLRTQHSPAELPIVIISGSGPFGPMRDKALARGANNFIPKCSLPTMIDRLTPILRRYGTTPQPQGATHD